MSLYIPESAYWRDPKLGPPSASNAPVPTSVCLLCHLITAPASGNREFETLSSSSLNENRNLPSYQVCIGKGQASIAWWYDDWLWIYWISGDLSRTVSQTFDCYDKSYLKHFYKANNDMNATYGCGKIATKQNQDKLDVYGTRFVVCWTVASIFKDIFSFNLEQANSRSRANWRDLNVNISCPTERFLCGLNLYMDGKFSDADEQEEDNQIEGSGDSGSIKIERSA